jgi:DNA-binding CsgD family transcriptional regulator
VATGEQPRVDASLRRGDWPLVGRDAELALATEACAAGDGVVLAGVAGVGKTRLAAELVANAARDGGRVVRVVATRSAASIPLGAFAPLVPSSGGADVQTVNAVVEWVRAQQDGDRPMLLTVDDAHLLDDASAAVLHRLVLDRLALPVVTVRSREPCPDPVVALWKDGPCPRIELQHLSDDETARLVGLALPGAIDEAVVQRLARVARGNPLMLRELMRGAVDDGVLARRHGTWTWTGPLSVAPALVDLLAARLRTIDDEARDLLALLAFAEPLETVIVTKLRGDAALERLQRAGMVHADDVVRLTHPLYGEAVRAELGAPTVARLSRELALAHPDALDEPAAELRRVVWHVDAGVIDDPEALLPSIQYAQLHDLALARRLAEAAVRAGAGIDTRLRLADLLENEGRVDDADDVLAAIAAETTDDALRVRIARTRATAKLWLGGRPHDARAVLEAAEASITDPALTDELSGIRLQVAMQTGHVHDLCSTVARVLDAPTVGVDAKVGAYAAGVAAWLLAGDLATAIDRCTAGLALTEASANAFPMRDLLIFGAALGHLYGGELDPVEAEFVRLRRVAAAEQDVALRFLFSQGVGRVALLRGRYADAVRYFQEARSLTRSAPDLIAWNLGLLAQAQALAGSVDDAVASLDEAAALTTSELFAPDRSHADALVAAARGERTRASRRALETVDQALALGQILPALFAVHDAARFGAARDAAQRVDDLAAAFGASLAPAMAAHVHALDERDAEGFAAASRQLTAVGCWRWAGEAATSAATEFGAEGLRARAEEQSRAARELAAKAEQRVDVATRAALAALTAREREVAALAARGETDKAIAAVLGVSIRTVETHLHRAYAKLALDGGRAELRAQASMFDA